MFKAKEGSSKQLIQFCIGYFLTYVVTGIAVKYFLANGIKDAEFLVYSTGAAMCVPTLVCIVFQWYKFEAERKVNILGFSLPVEYLYLIPSGICTAIVIPTTTMMYSLPISVMVAMTIMRGVIIIVSRAIDAIQIRQGYLKKKVYAEENWGVLFAMTAVCIPIFYSGEKDFAFLQSVPAMTIFTSYIIAYAIRIYIMNYYKNVAAAGSKRDNKAFFAIEQFAAFTTIVIASIFVFNSVSWFGWDVAQIHDFRKAFLDPHPRFLEAAFWGTFFGMAAFFSVFIFIFKGRTATFAGLVNRLTSLVAGTTSTLLMVALFNGKWPKPQDWWSLFFIGIAIVFSTLAERKRIKELVITHEIELADDDITTKTNFNKRLAAN